MAAARKLLLNRNLHVVFSVTLISVMGVSSIAPAFPEMSKGLGLHNGEIRWLIICFTFPGIVLSPLTGILADRLGRKTIIVPSLFLFAFAGTACAFTSDFQLLLSLRFLQGTGAASIASLNQTVIGDLFTGRERLRAMGYNATVLSIGTGIYPALGGAIALIGWNYPFLLSFLALPAGLLVLLVLDNPEPEVTGNFSSYFREALQHLKSLHLLGLFLASVSTFIVLYGTVLTYFPFFLKNSFGSTSLNIGIMISSASIGTALGSANLGRINRYISQKAMVLTGFFLYVIVLILAALLQGYYLLFIPAILYGFANGINIPTVHTLIAECAPMEYRGIFMSFNATVLRLGQTTGPFLAGLCFAAWHLKGIFYGTIILIALTALLLTLLIKKN